MSTDRLLTNKSFDQLLVEASNIIQKMKNLNDDLQSNEPEEFTQTQNDIKEAKQSLQILSKEIKLFLDELDRQAKGFDQKGKVKKIKESFQKEVSRHKTILEGLISWVYDNRRESMASINSRKQTEIKQKKLKGDSYDHDRVDENELAEIDDFQQIVPMEQLELDKLIIQEKQQEINALEKDALELNKLVGDINKEVVDQDVQLDVITDNQSKTKNNLQEANKELVVAQDSQKSLGRKYLIYCLIALVIAGIVIAIVFLTK